ncbi:HD-GYP domain-containing protein [Paenibacillus gansuensis]|uniref:HD-GYP domain-containing protein n=1 Tax=Paenibacillus gansuensis TaxID=306542 RepID=A0ABW5PMC7_9BACL
MPIVNVSQLRSGEKLNQNVTTSLGGTLFFKGKQLVPRDIEVLKAFLIPAVTVEGKHETPVKTEQQQLEPEGQDTGNLFYTEYDRMIALLKKSVNTANGGAGLPILDIRQQMESLVQLMDHYNILTFLPKMNGSDDYVYHNSILVALTSYLLARWHGFPNKDWMQIALAGLFHDIGNIKVDAAILNKPSKLTMEELEEMKKHTVYGYNLLKNVPAINEGVKLAALQHHEKIDGTGYPLGLKDEKIHIYAKVVAIADIFHAMTSQRAHKKAESPYLVLEQLFAESFGKLDPALVQTFIQKVTQFGNGTVVRLNDNRIGEVVFSDRAHPTRPWVKVDGHIVNLTIDRQYYIQEVIQ